MILRSLQISDEIIPSTELTWPLVQQALGCVSIDIEQIIQERRISLLDNFEIFLTASKLENLSLAVFVEDRRTSAGRTIKSNYQAYSGNQIRVRDLARPATRKFILSFFQYQFSEYDQVTVIAFSITDCVKHYPGDFDSPFPSLGHPVPKLSHRRVLEFRCLRLSVCEERAGGDWAGAVLGNRGPG